MTTANNIKLIKMLSDRYNFDADDAIEYVKTSSRKGRPKKEIEVEQAKDLFDKILEDAGEPPLEKDPALYKKFEKAPEKAHEKVNKASEKETKKLEKEKKAAEKAAEKEKKAAEKEAKKLEKEKKAAEKEAKKLEKEKKSSEKATTKKEVKPVVSSTVVVAPKPPVKTVTQVESSDDDSSDEEDEEEDEDEENELKPQEKELVVIRHTPIEELLVDEISNDDVDEDVNKIVQSVMNAKLAKYEAEQLAIKQQEESSDEEEDDDDEEEEEDEVVKVKRVKINNKDYLKSSNNVLYDVDTNDAIGVWDENKQEIILNELDEDSYVEDDDNNDESEDEDSDDEDE
jgi:hypothetical protein